MSDLDQMSPMEPEMEPKHDVSADTSAEPHDQEGKMAKADLYKLATYSHKLFKQLHDDDQLEAWVQAKITKAADYVASVYHYLEYEMKFSEYGQHLDNAETLSEGQRAKLQNLLSEAKEKVKELKKSQAKKVEAKKVEENRLQGGEQPCAECGGTGVIHMAPMNVHPDKQHLVDKHRVFRDAVKAIVKKGDTELTDEEYDDEERGGDDKTDSKFNVKKTSTGTRYTRKSSSFSDEHDGGDGKKSHAKDKSADEKKAEKEKDVKLPKHDKPTWGMKGGEKFGKKDESFGQGVYEAKKKGDGNLANNAKPYDKVTQGDVIAGRLGKDEEGGKKKVKEASAKCCCEEKGKAKCPVHGKMEETQQTMSRAAKGVMKYGKDGMKALAKAGKEGKDLDKVRDKYDKYDESAPSAGLSKEKKSAVVKKAKAGGDIGKPGKGFKGLAAKAAKEYGSKEKGEKVAAAAMWKNIKETVAYIEEKKAVEKKDMPKKGAKVADEGNEFSGELAKARADHKDSFEVDGKKYPVKESTDFSRMKELTKRLLG